MTDFSLDKYSDRAFRFCDKISSIVFPDSVTTIDTDAFSECINLSSVEFSDSLKTIGNGAFYDCNKLNSSEIPDSVTDIDGNPFSGCTLQITISPDHEKYTVIDNVLFDKEKKTLISYSGGLGDSSYTVPEGVLEIGDYAFRLCHLSSIEIPDSVTTIGYGAFYLADLTDIDLPDSLTTIEGFAFARSGLDNIEIPNSVITIGEDAFMESSLESIKIPGSVKTIQSQTFTSCINLKSIEIPDSVTTIEDMAFSGCENLILTVIKDSYAEQYAIDNDMSYKYYNKLPIAEAANPETQEYIFPDSDQRYLSEDEIRALPLQKINYAKNEIYARHGRVFKSEELNQYFNTKSWYRGTVSPEAFSDDVFNAYEKANVQMLSKIEKETAGSDTGYTLDLPGYDISAYL